MNNELSLTGECDDEAKEEQLAKTWNQGPPLMLYYVEGRNKFAEDVKKYFTNTENIPERLIGVAGHARGHRGNLPINAKPTSVYVSLHGKFVGPFEQIRNNSAFLKKLRERLIVPKPNWYWQEDDSTAYVNHYNLIYQCSGYHTVPPNLFCLTLHMTFGGKEINKITNWQMSNYNVGVQRNMWFIWMHSLRLTRKQKKLEKFGNHIQNCFFDMFETTWPRVLTAGIEAYLPVWSSGHHSSILGCKRYELQVYITSCFYHVVRCYLTQLPNELIILILTKLLRWCKCTCHKGEV